MNETEIPADTSLVELLDQLVVPELPAPISMVPQTMGWPIVGAVLVLLLTYALWRWFRVYRANAYRRAALAELAGAGDDPAQVARILRRAALAGFDRRDVAGLRGRDWIAFLEKTGGEPWEEVLKEPLLTGPYRHYATIAPRLTARAARWIRTHDREAPS
ncbi:DUF4381 domain-containing protein [Ruegeria sp. HKCCD8929]|uniref:DUF4381 domain-containing protein n=1 Tax=Ruegeria sp. HKCCD8929 TaxID=2683006 RepID=UPI0014877F9C|nr:DUF4381 domain-containing protein [Ruegeria sp. HKCCD8929]